MAHTAMVSGCVVLGHIVCEVSSSRAPVDMELALVDTVFEPVEAHVNGFGSLLLDSAGEDALCYFVVSLEGCCWLLVAKVFQGSPDGTCILGLGKCSANFSFRSRTEHIFHDAGHNMDGAIDGWVVYAAIAKVVEALALDRDLGAER
jgi:hypothetical protein